MTRLQDVWGDRPSIYEHLMRHIHPEVRGLLPGGETLPDDGVFWAKHKYRWVAGGLDGAFGHHVSPEESTSHAERVAAALRRIAHDSSIEAVREFYDLVCAENALQYIDGILKLIVEGQRPDWHFVCEVGSWLATRAPDREPVKVGIGLLGVACDQQVLDIIMNLGRHDEFTLYAAVAVRHIIEFPDAVLMELGQHVDGWGRVQVIERLEGTTNPDVRRWMLRQGYKTSVMIEYTAYTCATTGALLDELSRNDVDDEVFAAATDLLEALIEGGGTRDMRDYEEGFDAVGYYLQLAERRRPQLDTLLTVDAIRGFVDREDSDDDRLGRLGWTSGRRDDLRGQCQRILAWPEWPTLTMEALDAQDEKDFWTGVRAAKVLGIDSWEQCFRRIEEGDDRWFLVTETEDQARIERVIRLADARIPLDDIASGPALELGLGNEFAGHLALDWLLQGVQRFPGLGQHLIVAGLRSPVIRNRRQAALALSACDRSHWANEILVAVEQALRDEPDSKVRKDLERLLAGDPLRDDVGTDEEPA